MEIQKENECQKQFMGQIKKKNLISPHPLKNFKIQKYYQNEPRFNESFS